MVGDPEVIICIIELGRGRNVGYKEFKFISIINGACGIVIKSIGIAIVGIISSCCVVIPSSPGCVKPTLSIYPLARDLLIMLVFGAKRSRSPAQYTISRTKWTSTSLLKVQSDIIRRVVIVIIDN